MVLTRRQARPALHSNTSAPRVFHRTSVPLGRYGTRFGTWAVGRTLRRTEPLNTDPEFLDGLAAEIFHATASIPLRYVPRIPRGLRSLHRQLQLHSAPSITDLMNPDDAWLWQRRKPPAPAGTELKVFSRVLPCSGGQRRRNAQAHPKTDGPAQHPLSPQNHEQDHDRL